MSVPGSSDTPGTLVHCPECGEAIDPSRFGGYYCLNEACDRARIDPSELRPPGSLDEQDTPREHAVGRGVYVQPTTFEPVTDPQPGGPPPSPSGGPSATRAARDVSWRISALVEDAPNSNADEFAIWGLPLLMEANNELDALVSALVAATARADELQAERDEAFSHEDDLMRERDNAIWERDLHVSAALAAEARAAELETALRDVERLLSAYLGLPDPEVPSAGMEPHEALAAARSVLARGPAVGRGQ